MGIPLNEPEALSCMVSDLPLDTKKPSLAAAYARARGKPFFCRSPCLRAGMGLSATEGIGLVQTVG